VNWVHPDPKAVMTGGDRWRRGGPGWLGATGSSRAAGRGARGAIVTPAVLAFSDQVISGLVDFSGTVRSRLVAYLVLACAGAASVVLGT
jgi:hypothetical protein